MELGMSIDVLGQVLLLGKVPAADLALKLLETQVDGQEVSFEAEAARKLLAAVGHCAY